MSVSLLSIVSVAVIVFSGCSFFQKKGQVVVTRPAHNKCVLLNGGGLHCFPKGTGEKEFKVSPKAAVGTTCYPAKDDLILNQYLWDLEHPAP